MEKMPKLCQNELKTQVFLMQVKDFHKGSLITQRQEEYLLLKRRVEVKN
jgi:hypothetical protein